MASWQKYAAEAYGTFVLVMIGTGAIMATGGDVVAIAFAFGLALVAGLFTVGRVSGGHFNPAVSLGMFLDKRITLNDMLFYWVAQVIGGVLGSLSLAFLASKDAVAATITQLNPSVEAFKGFFGEAILTAIFVMAILVLAKSASHTKLLGIGLTLTTVHLAGIGFTGSSVNPARSLAPAIVGGEFGNIGVYLAGPAVGAVLAWVLYKVIVTGDTDLTDDVKAMK
jgi:aquaporin Z